MKMITIETKLDKLTYEVINKKKKNTRAHSPKNFKL